MGNLEVWYSMLSRDVLAQAMAGLKAGHRKEFQSRVEKATAKATTKDSMKAFAKLTTRVEGHLQIISDPPVIVRAVDLLPAGEARRPAGRDAGACSTSTKPRSRTTAAGCSRATASSTSPARSSASARSARAAGSCCSRGGTAEQDPLFLQFKEAQASVLERFAGESEFGNHGRRVVEGQRLMQSASDIMLGWLHTDDGLDGRSRDFYGRQLWDWKFSADVDTMTPRIMGPYVEMCAWTLARAHARSGDRLAIASYLGQSDVFDRAIADFAEAYADQSERDYESLLGAIESGRVVAETGSSRAAARPRSPPRSAVAAPASRAAPRASPPRRRSARPARSTPTGTTAKGLRLRPAEAAVRAHELLERRHLVRGRVIHAVDEQVRAVRKAVVAAQVVGRGRVEVGERVLALDRVVGQAPVPAGADHERSPCSAERTITNPIPGWAVKRARAARDAPRRSARA